jgi:hypothetical protein
MAVVASNEIFQSFSEFMSMVKFGLSPRLRTDRPLPNAFRYNRHTFLIQLIACGFLYIQLSRFNSHAQNHMDQLDQHIASIPTQNPVYISQTQPDNDQVQDLPSNNGVVDESELIGLMDKLNAQTRYYEIHSERLLWVLLPICFSFLIRELYQIKWRQICEAKARLMEELQVFERENAVVFNEQFRNQRQDDNHMRNDIPIPSNMNPNQELQFMQLRTRLNSHFNFVLTCVFCMLFCSCLPFGFQFKILVEILMEDYCHLLALYSPKPILDLFQHWLVVFGISNLSFGNFGTHMGLPHSICIWVLNVHFICFADLIVRLRIFATFALSSVDHHVISITPPNCAG